MFEQREKNLRELLRVQKYTAERLRDSAIEAHKAGMTWARIAEILGVQTPTLWRQCKAGSPVVAVRPFHGKEEE